MNPRVAHAGMTFVFLFGGVGQQTHRVTAPGPGKAPEGVTGVSDPFGLVTSTKALELLSTPSTSICFEPTAGTCEAPEADESNFPASGKWYI